MDLDNEDHSLFQSKFFRQAIFVGTNRFIPALKSQTLFNTTRSIIEFGKNKKYLDILFFYGNGDDKKKWKRWWLYFEFKFYQSAILYTCK